MMKQIMKNAIMMEGTVADHASTLIFVQIALVFQILLTIKYLMSLLEMDFVMTKPTIKIAILTEETAVHLTLLQIIALNAIVTFKKLVQLDFIL